jgi:adenylate kinase
MIMILLGAPGSGKGTQSKRLADKYGFLHLATGDIFRAEIAQGTTLGKKAQDYVKAGKLVPDNIVSEMVAARMEANKNYLLDGFPRNIDQARSLAEILSANNTSIDIVAYLTLSQAEAVKRMSSRRICSGCGEVYNTITRLPKVSGICDKCGQKVIQREDDNEATATKRWMVFEDLTHPLAAFYKADHIFHEVDASQSPEKVESSLVSIIEMSKAAR